MMKAAAPMMGGMIWPMVDEEASTPAAKWLGYPVRFINGIVNEPVVTVLSTELPEILGIADRVIVMYEGRVTGEFTRAEATTEKVIAAAKADGHK